MRERVPYMNLCFITLEQDVCLRMIKQLTNKNCKCFIQEDFLQLCKDLEADICSFDMLLCDFRLNKTPSFNIYSIVKSKRGFLPVIFYNDPMPSDNDRVIYWLAQNEIAFNKNNIDYLIPELKRINEVLCSPLIKPYVSLLQPPLSLYSVPGKSRVIDLNKLRNKSSMTPIIFKLFKYMYENVNKEISLKKLSKVISKKGFFLCSNKQKTNVYSYISRLRKILKSEPSVGAYIVRTSPGYYELIMC